jgi:hypothetical protein
MTDKGGVGIGKGRFGAVAPSDMLDMGGGHIVAGGFAREEVHADDGLPERPKPVAAGKTGLD